MIMPDRFNQKVAIEQKIWDKMSAKIKEMHGFSGDQPVVDRKSKVISKEISEMIRQTKEMDPDCI